MKIDILRKSKRISSLQRFNAFSVLTCQGRGINTAEDLNNIINEIDLLIINENISPKNMDYAIIFSIQGTLETCIIYQTMKNKNKKTVFSQKQKISRPLDHMQQKLQMKNKSLNKKNKN